MNPTNHLLALALATACLGGTVQAQETLADLKGVDTDGNGNISAAEARVAAERRYQSLDANKDGTVTQSEFVDSRLQMLAATDADGDGEVSRAEIRDRVLDGLRKAQGR